MAVAHQIWLGARLGRYGRIVSFFDGIIPLGPDWHGCCSCSFVADGSSWERRSPKPIGRFDSGPRRCLKLKTKQEKRHENNGDNCAGPQGEKPRGGASRESEGACRREEFEGQERTSRC